MVHSRVPPGLGVLADQEVHPVDQGNPVGLSALEDRAVRLEDLGDRLRSMQLEFQYLCICFSARRGF